MTTTIRELTDRDHAAWQPLWHHYLGHHGVWPDDVPPETWSRLVEPDGTLHGIGAFLDGTLVGFAHYLFHPHPWWAKPCCLLADVYTAPEARRTGVARALVEAVFARAAEQGADHVYGTTLLGNPSSHALYDGLAERLNLAVYRHQL